MNHNRRIDERPRALKDKQRAFKQGKPCAFCGQKLVASKMTVDHILPKYVYSDPYDETNWQVLCLDCHQKKSRYEQYIIDGRPEKVPEWAFDGFNGLAQLRDMYAEEGGK